MTLTERSFLAAVVQATVAPDRSAHVEIIHGGVAYAHIYDHSLDYGEIVETVEEVEAIDWRAGVEKKKAKLAEELAKLEAE